MPSSSSAPLNLKDARQLRVGVCDINGVYRGKITEAAALDALREDGFRMPLSALGVDIWGNDVTGNAHVFETGDNDGQCRLIDRAPVLTRSDNTVAALAIAMMSYASGEPFMADPRQTLCAIVEDWHNAGYFPRVAVELEFYLFDENHTARDPNALNHTNILSIDALDAHAALIDDIYTTAAASDIAIEATISESGAGQFELNLKHSDNVVKLVDDTVLLKHIIKRCAHNHALTASFMAKPYGDRAGNGLHIHFSLSDSNGNNVFDDGGATGSAMMTHAVAGLLNNLSDATLIYAPHANSYKRLQPLSHAPTRIGWGYDNRTASIRIPASSPKARRIEHRVAGADANPYLVMSAVLASAHAGVRAKTPPPAPVEGNHYDSNLEQIPMDWRGALNAFNTSPFIEACFSDEFRQLFAAAKTQEIATFATQIDQFEYTSYLKNV